MLIRCVALALGVLLSVVIGQAQNMNDSVITVEIGSAITSSNNTMMNNNGTNGNGNNGNNTNNGGNNNGTNNGGGYNSNSNLSNNNYGGNSGGSNSGSNNNNYGSSNNGYGNSNNNNYGGNSNGNYGSGSNGNGYGSSQTGYNGNSGNSNYGSNNNNYGSSNSGGGGGYGNQNSNFNSNYGSSNNYGSSSGGSNGYGSDSSNINYGSNSNGYGGSSNSNNYGSSSNYGNINNNGNNYGNNGNGNNGGSNYGINNNASSNTNQNNNSTGTGGLVYGSRYNSTGSSNNNQNNAGRCTARGTSTVYGAQTFYLRLRSNNLSLWNPRNTATGSANASNFAFRPVTINSASPNDFYDSAMFLARDSRGVTAVSMPFSKWYPPTAGPYSDYEAIIDYVGNATNLAVNDTEDAVAVRSHFSVTTFNTQFNPYPANLVSDRNSDPRLASAGIYLSSGSTAANTAGLLYGIVATNKAIFAVYARDAVVKANLTAPWLAFRSYRRLRTRTSNRELIDAAIQYDSANGEVNYYLDCVKVWTLDKFGILPNTTDGAVVTSTVAGTAANVPLTTLTAWSFSIVIEKPLDQVDPNGAVGAANNTQGLVRTDTSLTYTLPTSFWDPANIRTNVLYGEGLTAFFYDVSFAKLNVTLSGID